MHRSLLHSLRRAVEAVALPELEVHAYQVDGHRLDRPLLGCAWAPVRQHPTEGCRFALLLLLRRLAASLFLNHQSPRLALPRLTPHSVDEQTRHQNVCCGCRLQRAAEAQHRQVHTSAERASQQDSDRWEVHLCADCARQDVPWPAARSLPPSNVTAQAPT